MPKVMLLLPTSTYRAHDLLLAAQRLGVQVVVGSERRQALEPQTTGTTLTVDLWAPEVAVAQIQEYHHQFPLDAVIGLDDETTLIAAAAAQRLGLLHNPPSTVEVLGNKVAFRRMQRRAGLPCPDFRVIARHADPARQARRVDYPCVLKPTFLAASRGVIRADDENTFIAAFERIAQLLADPELQRRGGSEADRVLVEDYVPGLELALEGILCDGELRILALFDKPDPLVGPYFEETIYVTPSRLPGESQDEVVAAVLAAIKASGLQEGPVHAEVRLNQHLATVIEVAPRAIGGHCARVLRFTAGMSLEEIILRHALGQDVRSLERAEEAAGVMMIPIPSAGTLRAVEGVDAAAAVAGVDEVEITIHPGQQVVPLPEGNRYLGFIFARASHPESVETALRQAHQCLRFEIC